MTNLFKRLAVLFLAVALLLPCLAFAEEDTETEEYAEETSTEEYEEATDADEEITERDGWHFTAKGFLTGDNPGDEYILEDEKNGVWQYASADLSIRVTRYQESVKIKNQKKTREYCIAEVYASEASPLFTISTPATKKKVAGYNKEKPEKLVSDNPVILAVSDDYYGHRLQTAASGAKWPVGVIIRNGEVRGNKTRDNKRILPPLDTLAVYEDGSMKVNMAGEKMAEDFLAEGATQVFAFGPWLIRDGEINLKEAGPDSNYYAYNEPRAAIGMVEPFHYIAIVVKGEPKTKYAGVHLDWLADKMKECGCTEALNLDGGGTACMIFNGKAIIFGRGALRPLGSMIAFGQK